MNLSKKKALAVKTLKKGKDRIVFLESRLNDIKEAITKQDIRDLHKEGAIVIKEKSGRKKKKKRKTKKGKGNIRKKVNKRKKDYVELTRKLRRYLNEIKNQKRFSDEEFNEIGKKIRNKMFRS